MLEITRFSNGVIVAAIRECAPELGLSLANSK